MWYVYLFVAISSCASHFAWVTFIVRIKDNFVNIEKCNDMNDDEIDEFFDPLYTGLL